ncbi:transporter substrate-binding domain-containing protein [Luteimonas aestuarii]|nr:transporter substrate-binding domain-containing protein [Luteimonas aestuarii]
MRRCDDRAGDGVQVARVLRHLASLILVLAWMPQAIAQDTGNSGEMPADDVPETIRVGVYVSPPLVMKDAGGRYAGMAIELWASAARELGWNHEYVEQRTFGDLIDAVAEGDLDVAVTNLTASQERAGPMDFTHPWYDAGMRVLIGDGPGSRGKLLSALRQSGHLHAYAGLTALMLLATWLLTLFDRKYDDEFPRTWREGLAENLYRVVSVATSGKATTRRRCSAPPGGCWGPCGYCAALRGLPTSPRPSLA